MRIVAIRERTVPIASPIANAYIDFSRMTCSVVAVITDVVRDGHPVIGYGFNSNGRYGQGALMRERFIPRLLEADPMTLVDEARAVTNLIGNGVATLVIARWDRALDVDRMRAVLDGAAAAPAGSDREVAMPAAR